MQAKNPLRLLAPRRPLRSGCWRVRRQHRVRIGDDPVELAVKISDLTTRPRQRASITSCLSMVAEVGGERREQAEGAVTLALGYLAGADGPAPATSRCGCVLRDQRLAGSNTVTSTPARAEHPAMPTPPARAPGQSLPAGSHRSLFLLSRASRRKAPLSLRRKRVLLRLLGGIH